MFPPHTLLAPIPAPSGKTLLIRPGALGDVLVAMPALCFLKRVVGCGPLVLLAPSGRGKILCRDGWADETRDWDGALFTPLFQEGTGDFSRPLRDLFAGARLIVSFAGDEALARRLRALAPEARLFHGPVRPVESGQSVAASLYDATGRFLVEQGLVRPGFPAEKKAACMNARLTVTDTPDEPFPQTEQPYLVMHPGSGSPRKNWPPQQFIRLGKMLLAATDADSRPLFRRLVVTSGEADGELGRLLAAAVPGAVLCHGRSLRELAGVLAGADLYVGNDSGVSHLAGAVETADGKRPVTAVVFGPTDPRAWSPRDSLVLPAGTGLDGLEAEEAFRRVVRAVEQNRNYHLK